MIRQTSDLTAAERTTHEATYGGFNDFPPNWREVTEAEIATESMGRVYSPTMTEYRQMGTLVPGGEPMLPATLSFFHDGTGHAMSYDYYGKRLRWFRFFTCQHTMVEVSRPGGHRSGLHEDRCTKCGYVSRYDTSD